MFPTCPNKFTHEVIWNCIAQSSYLLTAHTFLSLWVKRSLSLCEDHAYVCSVSNQWWKNRIIKGHAQSEHSSKHTPYSLKQIESCSICEVQENNILQKLTVFSCNEVFLHGCYMVYLFLFTTEEDSRRRKSEPPPATCCFRDYLNQECHKDRF